VIGKLASLRLRLLGAMVLSAGLGLVGAALLYSQVERSNERTADRANALREARAVAREVRRGAGAATLGALQALLPNDQISVERDGQVLFRGPARTGRELETEVQAAVPRGRVRLADYASPGEPSTTLAFVLINGGVVALVILAAILTATLVTRSVRAPVARAIAAADRVARGEFTARMGTTGPEELVKLGRAFDHMAGRLERADSDQRQFLADVAHEIATPVSTVSGFALALADGTATSDDQRREARSLIEAETLRLRELLDDLRELTRLDLVGGVRLGSLELDQFVAALEARFRLAAEAAGVELTTESASGSVITDGRLLETISSNLLSNAIRYTPRGGRVDLRIRVRDGELRLSVRDTGVGIASEHQARIFDRLYRVDQTRDRETGGSGLGLAISLRAAQALGGRLEVDSAEGRGSEFRLWVPVEGAA
jgi:two-component system sensor histidine kinase SaeS